MDNTPEITTNIADTFGIPLTSSNPRFCFLRSKRYKISKHKSSKRKKRNRAYAS